MTYLYILLIIYIYYRQWKYRLLIDDPVPRDGYLYELPRKVDYSWYDKRRSLTAVVTNVATFIATCGYIHLLFGWKAAVLYAVFPLNVSGVAWNTGNYYMSTVLLCLASLYSFQAWGLVGMGLGLLFYSAALNSTLLSLPFFLILLFEPFGYLSFIPVATFLLGKRLRTGLKKRTENHKDMGVRHGFDWVNFYHVPRVIAYYVYLTLFPKKLGFFHSFGKEGKHQTLGFWIMSLGVCITYAFLFFVIDPKMALWWFMSIGLFSQFILLGQFVTERYTHLANVAFCVVISLVSDPVFYILGTLYFCRTMSYVGAWASNERLFSYSAVQQPKAGENWVNLASYYIERGDHFSAIKPLLTAERVVQGDKYGVWCDLANCYAASGFYEKALEYTNKALSVATMDKAPGMLEQQYKLKDKISKMRRNEGKLKRMGVI